MASSLPVHSGADIHLADAFAVAGCPLCHERARAEASVIESILSESVNDIPFRQALERARGLCGRHAAAVLAADRARAGSLGASILVRATLSIRRQELDQAHGSQGRRRRSRLADAARPPACPLCETVAAADGSTIDSLARLVDEPPWADAASASPICFEHLLGLADATRSAAWHAIETRQLERLAALEAALDDFAHRSSHDRRHLLTDELRGSVDVAVAFLDGDPSPR